MAGFIAINSLNQALHIDFIKYRWIDLICSFNHCPCHEPHGHCLVAMHASKAAWMLPRRPFYFFGFSTPSPATRGKVGMGAVRRGQRTASAYRTSNRFCQINPNPTVISFF